MQRSLARAVIHYTNRRGLRATLGEFRRRYVAGRQRWYVTRDRVALWLPVSVEADGLEYRLARADDLDRLHHLTRQEPATMRAWHDHGWFFFLALDAGVPIGYRCLGPAVEGWAGRHLTLRADQLFIADLFVTPAYRRRGIPRRLCIAMAPILAARGVRGLIGVQRSDNHESIGSSNARGIERLGVLTRTTVLGLTRVRFERAARAASSPVASSVSAPAA